MPPQKRHTSASAYPCIRCATSFATDLLEQKEDIRAIQVLLGHRQLETTSLYTQVATDLLRKVISPLDRLPSE
jgi:integrase/recombinase XerD